MLGVPLLKLDLILCPSNIFLESLEIVTFCGIAMVIRHRCEVLEPHPTFFRVDGLHARLARRVVRTQGCNQVAPRIEVLAAEDARDNLTL